MKGRSRLPLAAALVAVAGLAAAHVASYLAPFEDSYITYRYARNFASGLGLVYNAGERVEGCTSLGWTVVLGVLAKLGLPPPEVATTLSLLCGATLLVVTLAWSWVRSPSRGPWIALSPALVAASGTFAYFAGTGMETAAFALVVLSGVVAASSASSRAAPVTGVLLGVAAALRPEGVGYGVAILGALLPAPAARRRAGVAAAVFCASVAGLSAFRYAYFGDLLPNTYYAKATPSAALFLGGVGYVEEYLTYWMGWVGVGALGYVAWAHRRGSLAWTTFHGVVAAVTLAAMANSVMVGGDTFLFHRFLLPMVAPLALVTAEVAEHLATRAGSLARGLLAVAALGLLGWSVGAARLPPVSLLRDLARPYATRARSVNAINRDYFLVGEWLRDHLPAGTTLAVNAAGIVPYVSGLPTIDMLGLTDAHIAHRQLPLGQASHGHEKYDPEYVLDRAPGVIIPGLPVLAHERLRVASLGAWFGQWAPYMPGDAKLLGLSRLGEAYRLRVVEVREGGYLVLFVKRGSALEATVVSAP